MSEQHLKPSPPASGEVVWYRGWECCFEFERQRWTGDGWTAYKGGCDLDADQVSSDTWEELIQEINDQEDE